MWRMSTRLAVALGLLAALAIGGCAGNEAATGDQATSTIASGTTSTSATTPSTAAPSTASTTAAAGPATTLPAPAGEAFYIPPDPLPSGRPGDLIWYRPFVGSEGAQSYEILYRSTTVAGDPVAVSGVVVVPGGPATAPRPVLAWAHGTTGMGDQCAISDTMVAGKGGEIALAKLATGKGWVFVATDYQGLGTPGDHTYLVGQAEGRNVLDSIRAAQRLQSSGATDVSAGLVWGHSQGGGAAWFAAELAPTYAPDANVMGSAVGAPAGNPSLILDYADKPAAGFALMTAAGFMAAYPDLPSDVLTAKGRGAPLETARTGCNSEILGSMATTPRDELFAERPSTDPAWQRVLDENRAGEVRTNVPVFVYHGEADELLPVASSAPLAARACALGSPVQRKTYPGASHSGVIAPALGDIVAFLEARLAGAPFAGCA